MVLIDANNITHITFSIAKRQIYEMKNEKGEEAIFTKNDIPFFLHMLFKKINSYITTYGKLIFCMEGYHSLEWRRSIYPDYKRNRDVLKTDDTYLLLKETFPIIENILSMYPVKIFRVDEAEADDLIYTLSEKYHTEEHITIISTDNDFAQILNKFNNVDVYNPVKQKMVEKQPYILLEKAIVGDSSDNISGLNRIGQKTFEKMMEDKALFKEKMKDGNRELVETFLKIIDLSKHPYKEKILDKFNKTEYNKFKPDDLEAFFFEHKMKELLTSWGRYSGDIEMAVK